MGVGCRVFGLELLVLGFRVLGAFGAYSAYGVSGFRVFSILGFGVYNRFRVYGFLGLVGFTWFEGLRFKRSQGSVVVGSKFTEDIAFIRFWSLVFL